ncbi:MAG: alpha/beta fold hydrolase [Acidobacteriota bacterium]
MNRRTMSLRRKLLLTVAALYSGLLVISSVARLRQPPPTPPGDRTVLSMPAFLSEGGRGDVVDVGWIDSGPRGEGAPIVLLHGSPGDAGNFRALAGALGRRTVAIDMPGFGASSREVPDYSVRAHARYVAAVMNQLEIERFHVLGFSMGGGVGLHLAEDLGERVLSLSLVAAIGVQELELLGNYGLNHAIHGAQLAGLRAARTFVPHFGVLDDFPLDESYARNFYDTDQRPLRGILARLEQPLLIVHGKEDPLVPQQAATEHARIVPHSRLVMLDSSHFFIFSADSRLVEPLERFLADADRGLAPRRGDATPERIEEATAPFDPAVIPGWMGPALLVVLLTLALATFVSEDLTCIAAGLLVAQGRLGFVAAATACYVGIVVGDMLLFWAGRTFGRRALEKAPLRWWVSSQAIDESSRWLRRRGGIVVLLSRFLPGARLPTNLAAGVLQTSSLRFFLYFSLAGIAWTPPFVWLAARVGEGLLPKLGAVRNGLLVAVVLLGLLMWTVRHLFVPLLTWRGRRKLAGRWGRIKRWEFWPWWLIYPPVILHILRLGWRHRSLTLFTAVNPAMPGGGIVGESKSDILEALGDGPELPTWERLPVESQNSREERVDSFLHRHGLDFPVVLKPDTGERGDGVVIAKEKAEVRAFCEATPGPALVQQFAPGLEFGVFYVRGPDDAAGRILSVNEKARPEVVGDGCSTLEELILNDPRAVCIQDIYLRENPEAQRVVPAEGEVLPLTEVGAHSRGTLFLDACEHATQELAQALDRVHERSRGIDFGRFDVKVPDVEALRAGTDLKILELNGITSEAAHMYDPKNSLRDAWRILEHQWGVAFEIGEQRRRAGQPTLGVLGLARLVARAGKG